MNCTRRFTANKAYDRINLTVPKGDKEKIKAHAESKGMSVNSYINDLIKEDMKKGS
jgi:predicted DNA binding CopG/RHH family protein